MFRVVRFFLAAGVVVSRAVPASAETFTADPEAWRPVYHTDLRFPTGEGLSYASIWQDKLDENNTQAQSDAASPNTSYVVGNHNAKEWHFSINFQTKLVALTVLNSAAGCTDEIASPSLGTNSAFVPCASPRLKATIIPSSTAPDVISRKQRIVAWRIRPRPLLMSPTTSAYALSKPASPLHMSKFRSARRPSLCIPQSERAALVPVAASDYP